MHHNIITQTRQTPSNFQNTVVKIIGLFVVQFLLIAPGQKKGDPLRVQPAAQGWQGRYKHSTPKSQHLKLVRFHI